MIATATSSVVSDHALGALLREAAARATRLGETVTASHTVAIPVPQDPLGIFASARSLHCHATYWEHPAEGITLIGAGAVQTIQCAGDGRFKQAVEQLHRDSATALVENHSGVADRLVGPVVFGGFPFDPERPTSTPWSGAFTAGFLVLPRFLVVVRGGIATLTINARVEPDTDTSILCDDVLRSLELLLRQRSDDSGSDRGDVARVLREEPVPSPDVWKASVSGAAAEVRAGKFEKVVLARELRLQLDGQFNPVGALARLRESYPSAYVFAVANEDGCFLGATPELLVRLADGETEVSCLAGSTPRGTTPEEDERLGRELLDSAKNRLEHEVVARDIEEALGRVCCEVQRLSPTPALMRLLNVQHLHTPFRGRVAIGRSVLDLVETLHPTPAVGGYPRDKAMAEIREREGFDRGWYAGPVGWVNHSGDGEFAAAIRSAFLSGHQASLYAGGGIVGDSDPDAEYAETCLKLRPILSALGVQR